MSINFKLPTLDNKPILLAETPADKMNASIKKLPHHQLISACDKLVKELQALNSQKVAFSDRLKALEVYREAAIQIHAELLPHYSSTSLPIPKKSLTHASAAEKIWQELGFGYKLALVSLQNKIINVNVEKSFAHILQRAIHALKEVIFVKYMTYQTPESGLWYELHQLYFCALQQSAESLVVAESLPKMRECTVSTIYMQALLLALAGPQRLSSLDIIKTDAYLTSISSDATLQKIMPINNTNGVFLIELDSNKLPVSYAKNKSTPKAETHVLLLTDTLVKRIHSHLDTLGKGLVPTDGSLPSNAIINHYQGLLSYLIKNFGLPPLRTYNRSKLSADTKLGIGLKLAHLFISKDTKNFKKTTAQSISSEPSKWQVLNASAGGFALHKHNTAGLEVYVGDIVAIKNNKMPLWEIAVIRWASAGKLNQLNIGLELISPSGKPILLQQRQSTVMETAILLPEHSTLKKTASIIVAKDKYKVAETLTMFEGDQQTKISISKLVERTAVFEQFTYEIT